jgi:pimeloyl-ACP methyl ester carboxylesterase
VERIVSFMLAHPEGFETLEDAAEAIATYRPQRPRPKNTSGLRRTLRQTENGRWHWRWDVRFLTSKFQMTEHGVENVEERRALMEKFLLEGARKLTVPALLIRGATSDVVSLDGVSAFLEAVPHSEFVDVEQAGHMVAGDRNDVFADAVSEFLGRVYPIPAEWKHSEENQT